MTALRIASSDADLESWRQIRLAVVPGERTQSVGEVIGVASLLLDPERPGLAGNGYTAVRREWRGPGVAAALKGTTRSRVRLDTAAAR